MKTKKTNKQVVADNGNIVINGEFVPKGNKDHIFMVTSCRNSKPHVKFYNSLFGAILGYVHEYKNRNKLCAWNITLDLIYKELFEGYIHWN